MEPLGRFWESFWSFPGTFGRLLENVAKTIHKVTKVHQKSPKGGPEQSTTIQIRTLLGSVFEAFVRSADFEKVLKTGVENSVWKCPSSIAPATLLEVRGISLKNPNLTKV